ncbi:MAG: glycosyltransferase [Acidobacteriota bacterium]
MNDIKLSVIIPTHNRAKELADTLACLKRQSLAAAEYEIIVVDDGSSPPVSLRESSENPRCLLVRLEGLERSAARNAGAAAAKGHVLVFVDDDMTVGSTFLDNHLRAHREWPDALVVGSVRLPDGLVATPFGCFRQTLEQRGLPQTRGLKTMRNLCTAANMSIPRGLFHKLGGFDGSLASSEDQDFAFRHSRRGGKIAFIPEADAIHNDSALHISSYCRRAEWGAEHMVPFCKRYPDWPDNVERERVNGPVQWGREPLAISARKLFKLVVALNAILAILFLITSIIERVAPNSFALDRCYRLLLGAHIFHGYRKGRTRASIGDQQAAIATDNWVKADDC